MDKKTKKGTHKLINKLFGIGKKPNPAKPSPQAMPDFSDGVASPVAFVNRVSVITKNIPQNTATDKFNVNLGLPPEELDRTSFVLSNGTTESMGDGDKFGHRLENCKNKLVSSRGLQTIPANIKETSDIDQWFFNIPLNIGEVKLERKVACLLVECLGEEWEFVFDRLDFNEAVVSRLMEKYKNNKKRIICELLNMWYQWKVKAANFQELVNELILLHKAGSTDINWRKIKAVMTTLQTIPAYSKETPDIDPWFFNIPLNIGKVQLERKVACILVECLGEEWEFVFDRLDFDETVVSKWKEHYKNNKKRTICKLLNKWYQREVKAATFQELVNQLILLHIAGSTDINWRKIKAVMNKHVAKKKQTKGILVDK
ncbi:uncharacterized protein LOC131949130 [Physella acuta]|uniref:uncharacterized protein LOC131949130 n=1 Tax=Physella acuta TaxID=109671 RepID=UPI0027DE8ECF|nr:uncharacterized protein LOC131949130 [Physella acuta]